MTEKFYITTPAYYPNLSPHVGHAYTTIAADILARWWRLKIGTKNVMFISGLDEHGEKLEKAAKEKAMNPQEFVDMMAKKFLKTWKILDISLDGFIRTSEKRHIDIVLKMFKKIYDTGDIYKGFYEGWYCVPCESFWTELQLVHGKCPECNRDVKRVKEESYFFRLSKYQKMLLDLYEKNPEFISPPARKNEIINRVRDGLNDLSISRLKVKWGIPVPIDKKSTLYCWIDALSFYMSVLDYPRSKFRKFWPPDIQLMSKEINWFHSVIFPALLMSAKIPIAKKVFIHGWLTANAEKMSKSKGNFIIPEDMVNKYGVDVFRYFLFRQIPFGEDGDFSEKALVTRNNDELADTLGNLVHRVLSFIYTKNKGIVPKPKAYDKLDKGLERRIKVSVERAGTLLENLQLHRALEEIINLAKAGNEYFQAKEPWKGEADNCLYLGANLVRSLAIAITPYMPESAGKMLQFLNDKGGSWESAKGLEIKPGRKIRKPEPLFRKLEAEEFQEERRKVKVTVDSKCKELGIKARAALIYGASVKKKKGSLERLKKKQVSGIKLSEGIIKEYESIYSRLGVKGIKHPMRKMHDIVKSTGKLPTINTVVDSYNIVAARDSLSVGAHDLDRIAGNVLFKVTDGSEHYVPLGGVGKEKIGKEYACTDSSGKRVICRLDIKQCDETKISPSTRNIFLYVQGNSKTPDKLLDKALKEICRNITRFCGGECETLQ